MITVTDSALEKLKALLLDQAEGGGRCLRVFVEAGGCSGMQYGMAFDHEQDGDEVVEKGGVRMLVDSFSYKQLRGATIDFADGLNGAGFKISNPNATRTCGCGTSFEQTKALDPQPGE